ncbi:NUDIX domain-containing protein [Deinococcus radiophilus]|uniref:NUDIX hydrolase n=1 Tax=Deinococcus radiophilus TaxID=32062 RepID=A0A3S0JPV4_9DEIO|nr:NUDIX hydrolase [Deinococcus radiophilus]RTR26522.1 NUDIX hydrolase [Deinococcus radiophilus]UFA50564.1 NUDIX hydrolase [Deinococcus radiophilus]
MPFQPHPNWARLTEDDEQPWQTLSSRQLITGIRPVWEDRVQLPGGVQTDYQYRRRGPRAVFVLPITAAGEAVLIRQYRYPLRATITEVVAGGIERGEEPLDAAVRELGEEVGGQATEWVALPGFYPQPSISGVTFYAALALGVTLGEMHHEDTETIERFCLPLTEAYDLLERGEIHDASSALVLYQARAELQRRGLL